MPKAAKKTTKQEQVKPEAVKTEEDAKVEPENVKTDVKPKEEDSVEEISDKIEKVSDTEEKPKTKKSPKKKTVTTKKVLKSKKAIGKKGKTTKKGTKKVVKKSPKKTKKVKKSPKKKVVKQVLPKLSDDERSRYFKLLVGDDETPVGRFSGNKPKQAANKALTSIIKSMDKKGEKSIGVDITFTLKECTRWNKKKYKKGDKEHKKIEKKYCYTGRRELLKNEVVVDHIQKECDEKILKTGKITSQKSLDDSSVKYCMDVKEKNDAGKDVEKHIIVKKISINDKDTHKPTGSFKYAIINEIKYKCTNKVKKCKIEDDVKAKPKKAKKSPKMQKATV